MWSRIVLFSALAGAALNSSPAHSQECCPSVTSLFQKTQWVRLEIVGSRLAVINRGCGQQRTTVASSPSDDTRQTLSLQMQCAALVVAYEAENAGQTLTLNVNERGCLTIHRLATAGANASPPTHELRFCQTAEGKATLSVGAKPPQSYSADSFWHLMLAEPDVCRTHLVPLLETLRPHWRLEEQAAQLEAALLAAAGTDFTTEHRRWRALVADLGSGDFQTRQTADHELRHSGQRGLAFLNRLDPQELDAEQRRRLRAITADLGNIGPDTPERVATWLAADKSAWLALLQRDDLAIRTAAAEHLALLCRRNLPFDPQANELQRQAQLQKLRARLADQ